MKDLKRLKTEEIAKNEMQQIDGGLWYPRSTGPVFFLPFLIYKKFIE